VTYRLAHARLADPWEGRPQIDFGVNAKPKRQHRRLHVTAGIAAGVAVGVLSSGWIEEVWGTTHHTLAIITTFLVGLLAVWLAAWRAMRARQVASSLTVPRSDRLRASLTTGHIGEWTWDSATGEVIWDANVAALFGLLDGEFNGTVDMWMGLIDDCDREFVQSSVAAATAGHAAFRFDHRCTWPDGSTHWIESIGAVILAPKSDRIVGAFGLAADVDERHRQIEERTRLMEFERRQRERAEYMASINVVLSKSVDIEEIVKVVTTTFTPGFADWCAIVVSIDRPRSSPLINVAHHDPDKVRWLHQLLAQYPYDPDGRWGLSAVIRTGEPELVAKVDFRDLAGVESDVLANVDPASVISVPLVGALGTLGAMQVIRGSAASPFSNTDLEFVDEIGGRVAAALNTAVLFQRQARARAALETLQMVSGLVASIATSDEIVQATIVHGGRGIRATSGSLFLTGADGALAAKEEFGQAHEAHRTAELDIAQRAVNEGQIVMGTVATDTGDHFVAGSPMQILNRVVGALAFTFDDQVEPTPEELSVLATLGSRCASALERASLYERERTIALTLQHRLLSTLPETPDWIEAAASYVPATGMEIGGDWFQVLDVADGRLVAVVGDAVGHGLGSAAAMGQLRASFITAVANDSDPLRALAAVDLFAGRGSDTVGASAAYVLVDPAGSAQYASAGHPPIVAVRASGSATIIEGARGALLGCRTAPSEALTIPFEPGDLLIMFTDGLIETRTGPIDDGLRRLVKAVDAARHLPLQEMCDTVVQSCIADRSPDDDIAILILRRRP